MLYVSIVPRGRWQAVLKATLTIVVPIAIGVVAFIGVYLQTH